MKPNRYFQLFTIILLLVWSAGALFAQGQGQDQLTALERELADYIKTNYTKREVMIPMRDGVKLGMTMRIALVRWVPIKALKARIPASSTCW